MGDASKSLLERARNQVPDLRPTEVQRRLNADPRTMLIDIREQDEWSAGHIPGARHVTRGYLELRIEDEVPDKSTPIVLYCESGMVSLLAGAVLQDMGYANVASLAGGYGLWRAAGLPVEAPADITAEQRRRYSRHLLLPEIGEAGQAKLLQSRVLIVGAGGLGSPVAYYLAAAGVGTLGIIDADVVDASNLQRQILHNAARLGRPKVESARETLLGLNPDVTVNAINDRLTKENVLALISQYDAIVDGTDNFPTRYLLNDASIIANKPVVHGSVFRFEGQVTIFKPFEGPCYRCLFPEPPPIELAPNCAEAGVLGVLPGTIGLLQATETIKLLLGIGESLVGRLLAYDALTETFDELRLSRDPRCPACGENAHPEDLPTYEDICSVV
jgi:molybdopterin/thiamine biosynthesis adenylyltransferase/rhodanese-related sulfurtransferase